MRDTLLTLAASAALVALPGLALAQEGGAAAGAATGGVAGAVVGGPVGAAIGAAAGGAVGAAATDNDNDADATVEQRTTTTGSVGCESKTVKRTGPSGASVTKKRTDC